MSIRLTIIPFDAAWAEAFQQEKELLSRCLDWLSPTIEHIGSTAVIGLGGKPIIDVMIGLQQVEQLNDAVSPLMAEGYCYYPCFEEPPFRDRRFFARLKGHPPTKFDAPDHFPDREQYPPEFHLHLLKQGSPFWKRHLAFRNYLRRHPMTRDAYYRLKVKLAKEDWQSANDYAKAKTAFIRRVERLAELEG